jgi:transposase
MSNLSKKYNISIRSIYNYLNNKPKNHPEKISHKLNDNTIDSLRLDYINGIDINYLCGKYNISLTTAYKYTKDLRPIINKKLSNDDIENMRREYLNEGKTANELANKYGICKCTVYNYTRGLLDRSTYKISDNIIKSIREDYKNNIRIKDICDKYSISRSTAYKYIKLIEGEK